MREQQASLPPGPSSPPAAGSAPGPATDKADAVESAKGVAQGPPQSAASPLVPWLRALGASLVLTLLEMLILSLISHGKHPSGVWGVQFPGGTVGQVALATLMFGALRAVLVGGLLYLTGWSPSVGLLAGGALGFAQLGTVWGGILVGFAIGLALGGRKYTPEE